MFLYSGYVSAFSCILNMVKASNKLYSLEYRLNSLNPKPERDEEHASHQSGSSRNPKKGYYICQISIYYLLATLIII